MNVSLHSLLFLILSILGPFGLPPNQAALASFTPPPVGEHGYVIVINMHDTLQAVRARSFAGDMAAANQTKASAILIELSTPGGISSATDTVVSAIRKSHIPVIVWANFDNSRIGGQGLRILAEADASYMAETTYLSPLWADVPRGLTIEERTSGSQQLLAQLAAATLRHGRKLSELDELTSGVHWFSAREAVEAGLVDGTAKSRSEVLRKATGRVVTRGGRTYPLSLEEATLTQPSIDAGNLALLSLMNPNLDVLLLTLGLLLIYLEINTPGIVVPGAAGLLLLLLAAFALGSLPVTRLGIGLCVVAMMLLVLEARLRTRGVFAGLGILALIVGLGTLVDGPIPQLQVAWSTAIGAGIAFGGITTTLMVLASEAKRAKIKTGGEAMLGWLAVAHTPLAPTGKILVRGELWNARLTTHDSAVAAGDRVKVLRADNQMLEVTAVPLTHST